MSRTIYLVGSVPLANASEVFRTVGAALGPRLRWIPDGETGKRLDWITWLEPIFSSSDALEPSGKLFQLHATAPAAIRYRLKTGRKASDINLSNLLYADFAIESYTHFSRAKRDGYIPENCKFQVDLVPAHSVLWLYVEDDLQATLDPIYNEAVKREIDKIAALIPHGELAIQFDVASAVFARLQRQQPNSYGTTKDETRGAFIKILVDLGRHVPADIDLLFHFCYGDSNHRHVVEPIDMGDMVDVANDLTQVIDRPIQLIHMPVPRDRVDEAYFAPLRRLTLKSETQLCLGLVHYTDDVAGTKRRLATAQRFVQDFAIGTECGFGRRAKETIPKLLRIHAEIADL